MTNIFSVITTAFISIYTFSITSIDGRLIQLSQFRGKKILIVNTATKSHYASQISSLENLYQKYKSSLVIIMVPSNDFQHEPGTNAEIAQQVVSSYHPSFIISNITTVKGENSTPLYGWLSSFNLNGAMDNPVPSDFTKYLINESGSLIGAFGRSVDPMDSVIQNALTN